jgi:endonuclease/exonuclease/phosphatase family metal-dependent hydrolase
MARRLGSEKKSVIVLLVVVLGFLAFVAISKWQQHRAAKLPAVTTARTTIRIATWNLRKFSDGGQPPDLVEIASIIKSGQFDLVAIQEVQRDGAIVEKLRRQLNEPWRHVVSARTGSNYERYAFLYRTDRVDIVDGSARLLNGPGTLVFDRAPYAARFRAGQFDFMLAQVHLSYTDVAKRASEAQSLAALAMKMVGEEGERDVIVLGDFNEQRGRQNLQVFDRHGWRRLNLEPTNLSSTEVYDNLIIDPLATKEWTGKVGIIRFDETRYDNDDRSASELVSDHRPVWAEFVTSGPDDD